MTVFDPATAGFLFSDTTRRAFHLGFTLECEARRASCQDMSFVLHEVGPSEKSGGHGRCAFGATVPPLTQPAAEEGKSDPDLLVEWLCLDSHTAIFRLWSEFDGVLEVCGSFPGSVTGAWFAGQSYLAAMASDRTVALWTSLLTEGDRPPLMVGAGPARGSVCARIPMHVGSVARLVVGFDHSTHGAQHRVARLTAAAVDDLLNEIDATRDL